MYICLCMKMKVLFTQSCSTLWFHGLWPARLLCPWNFPVKNTGVGCHFLPQYTHTYIYICPWNSSGKNIGVGIPVTSPGDLPNPGVKPRSPTLQVDSLLSEPPGKSQNTEVVSHSLLQGIFLTQGSNQGLLHCRQILYHLRYQGRPKYVCVCVCIHRYHIPATNTTL